MVVYCCCGMSCQLEATSVLVDVWFGYLSRRRSFSQAFQHSPEGAIASPMHIPDQLTTDGLYLFMITRKQAYSLRFKAYKSSFSNDYLGMPPLHKTAHRTLLMTSFPQPHCGACADSALSEPRIDTNDNNERRTHVGHECLSEALR